MWGGFADFNDIADVDLFLGTLFFDGVSNSDSSGLPKVGVQPGLAI